MENITGTGKHRCASFEGPDVGALYGQIGIAGMLGKISLVAANKIIDDTDGVAAIEQQIDQVAADKTGTTGYYGERLAHAAFRAFIRRTLK
jgi:high-affinity K+ transport system ATPase subunit B